MTPSREANLLLPMDFKTATFDLFSKGLAHSDWFVRNECLSYLSRSPQHTASLGREALSQLGIHGPDFYEYAHHATDLPLDLSALPQLEEFCRKLLKLGDNENAARYLQWFLRVAPVNLKEARNSLERFDDKDFDHEYRFLSINLLKEELDALIEVSELSGEETIRRLSEITDGMSGDDGFPHAEWAACKKLSERLAHEDAVDAGRALAEEWLGLDFDPLESGPNDWKLLTAILLSGRLRMDHAAEKLLLFLKADWDIMNEEVERAFSRMKSRAALETIRHAWPSLKDYERLYLSTSLERVHPDGFDAFYQEALAGCDDDPFIGLGIARAMIHTGKQDMLDSAKEYLDGFHPDDPDALESYETLYAHYMLRRYRLDEAAEIESRLSYQEARRKERRELFERSFAAQQPVRKAPKVGRNDPCPCGSGKKYKKCCL
ncbi:MAG: SEC-C metal-binding domain-containing protein [Opitutales bacterium]